MLRNLPATSAMVALLALIGGLAPAGPAGAEGLATGATSAATQYRVTLAARTCPDYSKVMVGRVKDDRIEAPVVPGRDSEYTDGRFVTPEVETRTSNGCEPLAGWRFTFGSGHQRTGVLSTVTGVLGEAGPTIAEVPRLGNAGQTAEGTIAGAVTVTLTEDQVTRAMRRQLWVQAGQPNQPLLGNAALSFAAFRCGADGRSGGNVQWLAFPSGIRHLFCFAYYVKGASPTSTIIVRAKTTRPVGFAQRFTFATTFGFSPAKSFTLATSGDAVEQVFVRPIGTASYQVTGPAPTGWRVAELGCVPSKGGGVAVGSATVDVAAGKADLHLVAGEVLTCTYVYEPPVAPAGLTVRVSSEGGGGTFGVAVSGSSGSWPLTATPAGDGTAAAATGADLSSISPGTYTLTVTPPAAEGDAGWRLSGANCAGTEITPSGQTVTVPVTAGVAVECVLRVARSSGGLRLKMATSGAKGSGAFAVVAVDGDGAGWSATASTESSGAAVDAAGDGVGSLASGAYLVTPIAPRTAADGGWKLSTFDCAGGVAEQKSIMDPDQDGDRPPGPLVVTLRPGADPTTCTATWRFVNATRLRLSLQVQGGATGRDSDAAIEVHCADGSTGAVVLEAHDEATERSLDVPMTFLAPTQCTITHSATGITDGVEVVTLATIDPAAGSAPLLLPATVDLRREVAEYTVTVVETVGGASASAEPSPVFKTFRALPLVLVGAGLVGVGVLVLLIVVARWKRSTEGSQ